MQGKHNKEPKGNGQRKIMREEFYRSKKSIYM